MMQAIQTKDGQNSVRKNINNFLNPGILDSTDVIKKREQFAVGLRKEKTRDFI